MPLLNPKDVIKEAGYYHGEVLIDKPLKTKHQEALRAIIDHVAGFREGVRQHVNKEMGPNVESWAGGSTNFQDDIKEQFLQKFPHLKKHLHDLAFNNVENTQRRWLGLRAPEKMPEGYGVTFTNPSRYNPYNFDDTHGFSLMEPMNRPLANFMNYRFGVPVEDLYDPYSEKVTNQLYPNRPLTGESHGMVATLRYPGKNEKAAEDDSGPKSPPNYGPAASPDRSCGACNYFDNGQCSKYSTPVDQNATCSDWTQKEAIHSSEITQLSSPVAPMTPEQPVAPAGMAQSAIPTEAALPAMDSTQAFKFGFLLRCAEEGLSDEETNERVKLAHECLDKKAWAVPAALAGSALLGGASHLLGGVAAPAALGIGLGTAGLTVGLPHVVGNMAADFAHGEMKNRAEEFANNQKIDVQDFQNIELLNEYRRMTEELENQKKIYKRQNQIMPRGQSRY